MNDITLSYTWSDVNSDVNKLAIVLSYQCDKNDIVIAFNDDLIPAALIATRLKMPVLQIRHDDIIDDNALPIISAPVISGTGDAPEFPRIFFIVGYFNDNDNVKHIANYYESIGHSVDIVSICATQPSNYPKIHYYQTFIPNPTKVIFPWTLSC